MKQTLLSITLLFICVSGFAQTVEVDARIYDVYGASKVQWMSENDPGRLEMASDVLFFSYEFMSITPENTDKLAQMKEVTVDDLENINVLLFAAQPLEDRPQFYHISNHNLIIRIKTKAEFDNDRFSEKKN